MGGYPEQLEWLATRPDEELEPFGGRDAIEVQFLRTALAACDFDIDKTLNVNPRSFPTNQTL